MPHRNKIFVNHILGLGSLDVYEHIGWDNDKNSKDYTPMPSRSHIQLMINKHGFPWAVNLSEKDVEKLIKVLQNYLDLFKYKGE